jgi:hypothetical protein
VRKTRVGSSCNHIQVHKESKHIQLPLSVLVPQLSTATSPTCQDLHARDPINWVLACKYILYHKVRIPHSHVDRSMEHSWSQYLILNKHIIKVSFIKGNPNSHVAPFLQAFARQRMCHIGTTVIRCRHCSISIHWKFRGSQNCAIRKGSC